MSNRGEVLVGILKTASALIRARDERWYHVPTYIVQKRLKNRWPPKWMAFYQGKVHGNEAYSIRYYAQVLTIRQALRRELFPEEVQGHNADREYYKINLGPLQTLTKPILSRRWRRIVFIPTTWEKLMTAIEINDLYDESPLEDRLWAELKRLKISAERQEFVKVKGHHYALDFAIYCTAGKLDIETDGDTWHSDPARIPLDNVRDNDLETAGWRLLRFNGHQVREEMNEYCLPTIVENISNAGGIDEGRLIPRQVNLEHPGCYQLGLFDD
ncbi:endonuclease domain-containing protein [Candidatus Hydrogenedentota bacterium]